MILKRRYPKVVIFPLCVLFSHLLAPITARRNHESPQNLHRHSLEGYERSYAPGVSEYSRREAEIEPSIPFIPPPTTEEPMSKIQTVIAQVQQSLWHQEANCQLSKVELTQVGQHVQYVEYDVSLPPITQFHFCIWIKSRNLTTEHVIFSYSVRQNPDMVVMWISPLQNQTGFHLVINGIKVYNLNYIVSVGRWFHVCQSWNGENGQWGIFVNGVSVGDGYGPQKLIGFTIPGGGKPITGQDQDASDVNNAGRREGIEGEITLFEMHNAALPVGSKGSALLRPLQTDCLPKKAGNLISWERTHLKLFGGGMIYGVKPICASFPEFY